MKLYRVEQPVTLRVGVIGLNTGQASVRGYCLAPTRRKGCYEVTGLCSFKAGEVIGLDRVNLKLYADVFAPLTAEEKANLEAEEKAAKGAE